MPVSINGASGLINANVAGTIQAGSILNNVNLAGTLVTQELSATAAVNTDILNCSDANGFRLRKRFGNALVDVLTVEPTNGYIRMPRQPRFVAYGGSTGFGVGDGGIFTFPNIAINIGNWFNGSRATAPITGVYGFWVKVLTNNDGSVTDLRWFVNGVEGGSAYPGTTLGVAAYAGYSGNWSAHKPSIIYSEIDLNAGDFIDVRQRYSGTGSQCCGTHTVFLGRLIG